MSTDPGAGAALAVRFDLGPIDQISFAVENVEKSVPAYEAVFGGTFTVRDVVLDPATVSYLGRPANAVLRLGFGETAGLEIELVEVLSGDAPSLEHLRRHGEGLHHVRFPVLDLDAKTAELEGAGFSVIFGGSTPSGSQFAYVHAPEQFGYTTFELIQQPS